MTKEKKIEPVTEFCKMSSNNQITIPKLIREKFGIGNLKGEETVLLEIKFIRVVEKSEEEK